MADTVKRGVKRTAPRMRRKNLILDQTKIDRAQGILGAKTEIADQ